MIDPRYPRLSTAIVDSLLWRGGRAVVDAFARAWPGSHAAELLTSVARLRGVASVASVTAAAGTIAVLVQFVTPRYVRSGLPLVWPVAAIVWLIIIATSAATFERAWPHSRLARLVAPPRHLR